MSAQPDDPNSEPNLESPVYRERLKRKLDCLIAVLEVATAKVRRSLAGPDADIDRLRRIEKNLGDTLSVCRRAKLALERREKLPEELPFQLDQIVTKAGLELPQAEAETHRDEEEPRRRPRRQPLPQGMVIEMSSAEEYERFRSMQPIDDGEIQDCDVDDLCRRLLEG